MINICDEPFGTNCFLCGRRYKHSRRYYSTDIQGVKEVDLITHCATCRNLLHRIYETRRKLNELETEVEYYQFMKDK